MPAPPQFPGGLFILKTLRALSARQGFFLLEAFYGDQCCVDNSSGGMW